MCRQIRAVEDDALRAGNASLGLMLKCVCNVDFALWLILIGAAQFHIWRLPRLAVLESFLILATAHLLSASTHLMLCFQHLVRPVERALPEQFAALFQSEVCFVLGQSIAPTVIPKRHAGNVQQNQTVEIHQHTLRQGRPEV